MVASEAGESDDDRAEEQPQRKEEQPTNNKLATAPLFWMRQPILLACSDTQAENGTAGTLDRLDPRMAEVLREMGVDNLFSIQDAMLDAFKARSCYSHDCEGGA